MVAVPTPQVVAEYIGDGTEASDIEDVLAAEQAAQAARCRVVPFTADLAQALKRRVMRNVAMRGVPLGVQENDAGGTYIAANDPEVRRLEAPYRKLPIG